jgi:hypothetical protein
MEQSQQMSVYDQDGLRSVHNHEFMRDENFQRAYDRGVSASGRDYQWHWRVHVGLWAAASAAKLAGDFVECGVNRGFMSSAIMNLLQWDSTGRKFYLLDTFSGIDERYVFPHEKAVIMEENAKKIARGAYTFDVQAVRDNFSEWKNAEIVVGPIPETLSAIKSKQIAFLHLDLNCSLPEVATMEALWDRLTAGAFVLLDDYAYLGYRSQKLGVDAFAQSRNIPVLSLPTGQGLIMRPPSEPPPRRTAASSFNTNWVRRLTTHMLFKRHKAPR